MGCVKNSKLKKNRTRSPENTFARVHRGFVKSPKQKKTLHAVQKVPSREYTWVAQRIGNFGNVLVSPVPDVLVSPVFGKSLACYQNKTSKAETIKHRNKTRKSEKNTFRRAESEIEGVKL